MAEPIIEIKKLGKKYKIGTLEPYYSLRDQIAGLFRFKRKHDSKGEFWALKNISFSVDEGEVIGIIGRNGAGKSTLLKILSQITPPTRGEVTIRGRVASLLEVGTGFHPELTGRENIYLNGAILGMNQKEIKRKFNEIVEFSEIEKFLDTPVKRYSSGMYVRLAFAVAAHLEPEILIIDEVLAVGDIQFQKKCLGKMQDVAKGGRTVLFVSHNMNAIQRLCSRCFLLDKGKIISSGKTDRVIKDYISNGLVEKPELKQPHSKSKLVNIRRVCLTTKNGKMANEFRYDEQLKLIIEYEVNQPVSHTSIWFGLRSMDDTIVFGSADTDENDLAFKPRAIGYYSAEIAFPTKLLNFGDYYLVIGAVQQATQITYDRVELRGFTILDIGTPEAARPGFLQPIIEWKSKALKDKK